MWTGIAYILIGIAVAILALGMASDRHRYNPCTTAPLRQDCRFAVNLP
jgi:uncharacterized membrane protein YuzA (DUF378 family)